MRYISDLHERRSGFRDLFMQNKITGNIQIWKIIFDSLTLQDKTGMIDGKVWELTNCDRAFRGDGLHLVRGQVTSYQGSNQFKHPTDP